MTNPNAGERVTFRELFTRHPIVEVPIIQRDYVQGRTSESEVRTEFLKSLHAALSKPKGDPSLPLDLDFVYGSVEGGERQVFCPLDGQQRLTTLFLLHWYLAWKDGRADDFTALVKNDRKSRFSYAVRPSSSEFFDALTSWYPDITSQNFISLSAAIADQPWFFRSWRLDPTIQSALTMLDALHEKFALEEGFYDRLMDIEHPFITFQLLDLRSFGLSDDLYIKMNARGKPLTPFETFKAKLEKYIDTLLPNEKRNLNGKLISIRDYFSHRIDTAWADLFWKYRDPKTNLFDDRLMHLVRAIATVTREPTKPGVDRVLVNLRNGAVPYTILKYQEQQCLDHPLLETLITVLDRWCGGSNGIKTHLPDATYFDEKRIFEKVIKNSTELTYEEMVQFHAYTGYLVKHRSDLPTEQFGEWMRVIRNLTVNTNYDDLDDFKRSLRSVNEIINEADHILQYLSGNNAVVSGFNEQQVREEMLKAQLIRKSNDWRSLILKAEQHGYFNGQIEFLFDFSKVLDHWLGPQSSDWSAHKDAEFRQAFADYFAKASKVFSANGLNDFGEYRWERALLSIGSYWLPKNSNVSFLSASDRDASWKRLLRGGIRSDDFIGKKRQYVNELLNRIDLDIGVKESLSLVIDQASPEVDWRRAIVENPNLIAFCGNRMMRITWDDKPSRIYLLRKMRMSGEHAELFTYHLKVGLLSDKHKRGELAPFTILDYRFMNTDSEEPYAYLQSKMSAGTIVVKIFSDHRVYELKVRNCDGELPAELAAGLAAKLAFKSEVDETITCIVERAKIEEAIDEMVAVCRKWESTGGS